MRKPKKLIRITSLFFCSLLIFPAQSQLKVFLEEVLALGDTFEDLIYQRPGVTTDENGNIYITDFRNNSIKKYSAAGGLIKEVGYKGEESGELKSPNVIRYHEGKVYVSEAFDTGILVFDENLEYQFKIPLRFTLSDIYIYSKDQIAVSTLIRDRDVEESQYLYCIYVFNSKANEVEKVVYATDTQFTLMNMVSVCLDKRNNVYIAYTWEDKIEKIDRNGQIAWSQSLLGEKKVKMRIEKGANPIFGEYPLETTYKSIALDSRGYLLVLGGHLSENSCRDIYILNLNGQLIATFTLPEPAHAIHIDSENFLYARSDKGTTLRKYSLKYFHE